MGKRTSRIVSLGLVLGVAVLGAQVAGVGGTRPATAPAPASSALATVAGSAVPDVGSTKLASSSVKTGAAETVRMRAKATVTATAFSASGTATVVCGIRYSRDGDASWTLGTPYETTVLTTRSARATVAIDRSFAAPAGDTYRMSVACHVSTPVKGARVTGTGSITTALGLPDGAAQPAG